MPDDDKPVCPCDAVDAPRPITNPPGQDRLAYRIGDFADFRRALLRGRQGEMALREWRPGATGDLAVLMAEWWAYLADILTFYNERIASQYYLATADETESVARLVRLLGYRPRPAIGAKGTIAALALPPGLTVPAGFAIADKPPPGKAPQTFETDADAPLLAPGVLPADLPPLSTAVRLFAFGPDWAITLRGAVSGMSPGERLALLPRPDSAASAVSAAFTLVSLYAQTDPNGAAMTILQVQTKADAPSEGLLAASYSLFRPLQTESVWQIRAPDSGGGPGEDAETALRNGRGLIHLRGLARSLTVHDWVMFSDGTLGQVSKVSEELGYPENTADFTKRPASVTNPVAVLHSVVTVTGADTTAVNADALYHGWREIGPLRDIPATEAIPETLTALIAETPRGFFDGVTAREAILTDAEGAALRGKISPSNTPGRLSFAPNRDAAGNIAADAILLPPAAGGKLRPPFLLLYNPLDVSRGETVLREILGDGDAARAAQEFALKKFPLTYLPGEGIYGNGCRSSLRVRVNDILWEEVASFYKQSPDAQIFVTREDADGKTHVAFGDGVNGARLPSGTGNVVASYRVGAGAETPAPGTLTVPLNPLPNLTTLLHPLPLRPGADADAPRALRKYAPRSVLTFGRAVSTDDYEAIAALVPGVVRVRAGWEWDANAGRKIYTVYFGDNPALLSGVQEALNKAGESHIAVRVRAATAAEVAVTLTARIAPRRDPLLAAAAVRDALLNEETGLFGPQRVAIGQRIFHSEIEAACLTVPGVVGVTSLTFTPAPQAAVLVPQPSEFLRVTHLTITTEVSADGF